MQHYFILNIHKMKKSLFNTPLIVFFFFSICSCSFTSNNDETKLPDYIHLSGFTQGTTYSVIYTDATYADYSKEIDSLLRAFSKSLSTYDSMSVISRINRNDTSVIPDSFFTEVFNKSIQISKETDGAFDITVASIANTWGFGSGKQQDVDSTIIDSLLQFVGYSKIRLDHNCIIKQNQNITLNVNAIAQGYSVDIVAGYLESKGIENYMVEIGGELKTRGKNPKGELWKIGIDKPDVNNSIENRVLQTIIQISGKALATSGNYRKFIEKDGVKYSHTLNPKTGYPVMQNLLSATIITDDCIIADAYATACMVKGLEDSKQFIKQHPETEAYFVYSDKKGNLQVYSTTGIDSMIVR